MWKTAFKIFLKGYGLLFKFIKGCLPQILLNPFLNTSSHTEAKCNSNKAVSENKSDLLLLIKISTTDKRRSLIYQEEIFIRLPKKMYCTVKTGNETKLFMKCITSNTKKRAIKLLIFVEL